MNNPFVGVPCKRCGAKKLRLERRATFLSEQEGTFSLAGVADKTSAVRREWPWCVCDGCGAESAGKKLD